MSSLAIPRSADGTPQSVPRLDPHGLPPATTGRFLLLLATAVASSVQVYAWLVERLAVVSGAPSTCVHLARTATADLPPAQLVDWYSSCVSWTQIQEARVIGLMLVLFVAVVVAIYLILPARHTRGLVSLAKATEIPDLAAGAARIERIVSSEGRRPDVSIYVDTASARGANRAFGRLGRYSITVDIALLRDAAKDQDDARVQAVLRHELAHIRNRDLDLTVLTIAVWWGFLAAVVVPFTIIAVNAPGSLFDFSWRLATLLALLWFVRASVLRSREYYADVRSADTPAAEQELVAVLRTTADAPAEHHRRTWSGMAYRTNHPSAGERVRVIESGTRLFRLSAGLASATGSLVGLAYPPLEFLLSLLLPEYRNAPMWICGMLFGLLVAAILGGATWRAALGRMADPTQTVHLLPAAAAFTGALLLSLLASAQVPQSGSWTMIMTARPSLAAAYGLPLLGGVYVYLRWMLFCASSWLPVAGRPKRAYHLGVAQSAVVIGVWLSTWFGGISIIAGGSALTGTPTWLAFGLVVFAAAVNPLTIMSIGWGGAVSTCTLQSRRMARRAHRYPWWRPDWAHRPVLAGTRTPLAPIYLMMAAVAGGYWLAGLPLYPRISAAVDTMAAEIRPSTTALIPIVLPLVVAALVTTAVVLFAYGLAVGGQARLDRVVASAAIGLVPTSIVVLVIMLIHLTRAAPTLRSVPTLLLNLSGLGPDGLADRPANPALGVVVLVLLALMYVVGLPAAALGSLIRAARPARPSGRPAERPVWLAAVLIVPLAVGWAGLAYFSWSDVRVPAKVAVSESVNLQEVGHVVTREWPQSVPLPEACLRMIDTIADPAALVANADSLAVGIASAAMEAASSSDPTLQAMGEATIDALWRSEILQASQDITVAVRYCAAAAPST